MLSFVLVLSADWYFNIHVLVTRFQYSTAGELFHLGRNSARSFSSEVGKQILGYNGAAYDFARALVTVYYKYQY